MFFCSDELFFAVQFLGWGVGPHRKNLNPFQKMLTPSQKISPTPEKVSKKWVRVLTFYHSPTLFLSSSLTSLFKKKSEKILGGV